MISSIWTFFCCCYISLFFLSYQSKNLCKSEGSEFHHRHTHTHLNGNTSSHHTHTNAHTQMWTCEHSHSQLFKPSISEGLRYGFHTWAKPPRQYGRLQPCHPHPTPPPTHCHYRRSDNRLISAHVVWRKNTLMWRHVSALTARDRILHIPFW